jgi:UDP-N-acetylmuramate--alanine ligase
MTNEGIAKGLADYAGVQRRFDFHIRRKDLVYIDDYAHHPEELRACIEAVKELYPGRKITGVFQPHLFTRTRDFADEFAKILGRLDRLILLDIYPAREKPVEGVDSAMLLDKINIEDKMICKKQLVIEELLKNRPEVLLTLGAGDIDQLVIPLTKALS